MTWWVTFTVGCLLASSAWSQEIPDREYWARGERPKERFPDGIVLLHVRSTQAGLTDQENASFR